MEYIQALQTLSARYQKILQTKQSARNEDVEEYRVRLPALATRYGNCKKAPEPVLTIPRIFGRTHDENFISDYLAYILDPGKNGLGTVPLETFLRLCHIDFINIPLEHAHIRREYGLENGRIDLLIECDEYFVVGVENKIYSQEGSGQTTYYSRVMDEVFSEIPHSLVFLTREGYPAGSKRTIPISYAALWETLRNVSVTVIHDRRKLVLWEDFLEHLEVYIMKNDSKPDHFEFSEKAQLFIDNYEMITDLTETYKQERRDAIAFVEARLKNEIGAGWETYFSDTHYYQQLYRPQWRSININIHFEWWLSFDPVQDKTMKAMVDVEGKRSGEALAFFDLHCKNLMKTFTQLGIEYRPKRRKLAIAFKQYPEEYSIVQNINKVSEKYIESFDEFRFLEPVIDEVVAELSMKA